MSAASIAVIVGGYGEVEAVPILIRRIACNLHPGFVPSILSPIRVPESRLRKQGELERTIKLAGLKLGGRGAILVVIDCDWDGGCPRIDGPELLNRARLVRQDVDISVVLAKHEFESWFIAAAESLRGIRGLRADLTAPADPESIRGAKEWLNRQMQEHCYSVTTDQPAFTAEFDLELARRADSFDKCYREITRLLEEIREQN